MTLPTYKAPLDIIPSSGWNDIVDSLIDVHKRRISKVRFTPVSAIESTASSVTLWLSPGSFTVPAFADFVDIDLTLACIRSVSGAYNGYFQVRLDNVGATGGDRRVEFPNADDPKDFNAKLRWTGLAPDDVLPLTIWAQRSGGAGALRANELSHIEAIAHWSHS